MPGAKASIYLWRETAGAKGFKNRSGESTLHRPEQARAEGAGKKGIATSEENASSELNLRRPSKGHGPKEGRYANFFQVGYNAFEIGLQTDGAIFAEAQEHVPAAEGIRTCVWC
jgi:hypothetical protein